MDIDCDVKLVARFLKIGWDTVKDIVKRNLKKRFSKPKLGHLKNIAIDEISVAKGRKYLTVALDLDSGKVAFVSDGKGSDAPMPFWKRLILEHLEEPEKQDFRDMVVEKMLEKTAVNDGAYFETFRRLHVSAAKG